MMRGMATAVVGLILTLSTTYTACRRGPTGFNLVLVSVDTLRADHLSSYGGTAVRTPNIDRLAADGILYENVATVAPTTLPAHASLFTGLTPLAHRVHDNVGFYLDDRFPVLAAHLKAQGYDTAAFVGAFVLDSQFGLDRGFDVYDDDLDDEAENGFVSQRRGDEVLNRALAWLDSRPESSPPFFAFVHFYDPHMPYENGYPADVAYVDSLVGELLAFLDRKDLTRRTLFALVSDHGESLGEHGEDTHGLFVYESTLRIPFLLRYPGAPAGTRVSSRTSILDVGPKLLEVLRLPPMVQVADEFRFYAESHLPRLHYGWSDLRSLTRWPHKLVLAPRAELYDLSKDPAEERNLIQDLPVVAGSLRAELEAMAVSPFVPRSVDPTTRERLEALGYAGGRARPAEGDLPDPKDRLEVYRILNDPALQELRPEDGPRFEKALSGLRRVLETDPGIPRSYLLCGELLLEANRAAEAVEIFEKLTALEPSSFEGHYGLGVALQRLGRTEEALVAFAKAQRFDPRSLKTYVRLSEVDVAQAEGWLRRALAIHEDRAIVDRLAQVLATSGRSAEALALLEELAQEHPGDGLAAYNLGQLLLVEGRTEAALKELLRARELSPDDPDVHQAVGNALAALGRREEAIASFVRATELTPCFAPALANLGAAYAEMGRFPEAARALENAVGCDPAYAEGYRNLAAVRLELRNLEGAVAAMRKAVSARPGDPELEKALEEILRFQRLQKN